jgi:predicted sulfurtransferase
MVTTTGTVTNETNAGISVHTKMEEEVEQQYCVLAFYQFFSHHYDDITTTTTTTMNASHDVSSSLLLLKQMERQWRDEMETFLRTYHTYGMIRLSIYEGMNGTICFPTQHLPTIQSYLQQQQQQPQKKICHHSNDGSPQHDVDTDSNTQNESFTVSSSSSSTLKLRRSYYNTSPFHRLSIRIKSEIVTMGPIPQHWIITNDAHNNNHNGDDLGTLSSSSSSSSDTTNTAHTTSCIVRPYNSGSGSASASSIPLLLQHYDIPSPTGSHHPPPPPPPTRPIYSPTGIYVSPGKEWDDLIHDPQCLVIDTRNQYEIQIGTFHNAISPHIQEFTEFPSWLYRTLQQQQQPSSSSSSAAPKYNKIAMFCTGGIRCEKATALCIQMLQKSSFRSFSKKNDDNDNNDDATSIEIPPVYHLEGGILAYLEKNHPLQVVTSSSSSRSDDDVIENNMASTLTTNAVNNDPPTTQETGRHNTPLLQYGNSFIGECFVFDQRVAVTYGLQPTQQYISCHACRHPVHVTTVTTTSTSNKYQKGICCPNCYDDTKHNITNGSSSSSKQQQRQRYMERQKQIDLAAAQKVSWKPHLYDSKYIPQHKTMCHEKT